jgi:DNA-binding CsgD family transcriptional regulator
MHTKKRLGSQASLFCGACNKLRIFDLQENIKKCTYCLEKTSYRAEYRRRWSKEKSDPSKLSEEKSLYYRTCSDATIEEFEAVMGRMHKLSRREYEVVQLLWEGKTTYDVAKILSISQGNVTTLLERARVKLK